MRIATSAFAFWFAAALGGQPQGGYVGAQVCGSCHPAQFRGHALSGHARALGRAEGHPLAVSLVKLSPLARGSRFRFRFLIEGGQLRVRAWDQSDVMDIPVEWVFGAGTQAATFVTRVNEEWYLEHYFSYYSTTRSLGPTPGQGEIEAKDLRTAMGLLYRTLDPDTGIRGCFECHSTGPATVGPDNEIRPQEPGVRCEACHGPGAAHVKAGGRAAIRNPGRMSANELNSFCGKCHRPPAGNGARIDWTYAWNVRHQPVYFSKSACFRKSNGALTCLACHSPHEPLRTGDSTHYNQKCRACHTTRRWPPKPVCEAEHPANCVDCHMPRVAPQSALRFANHWIGVYKQGAKLRPR